MRAVVVAGSETPEPLGLPSFAEAMGEVALVVLADGGGEYLEALSELGVDGAPMVLVGDMDSISSQTFHVLEEQGAEIQVLPAAKDETDLEFALKVALERGADDLIVLAALGGPRLDHLLGTVALLNARWLQGCRVRLLDGAHEVFMVRGEAEVRGEAGDLVSLIPMTPVVEGVVTEGLAYPLCGERLMQGSTRGVSNALTGERARVAHGAGDLLIVHYRPSPRAATAAREVACQFSLYPLRQDSIDEAIRAGIEAAARSGAAAGMTVRVQTLSTLMQGPEDAVFRAAREAFDAAIAMGPAVMICAVTPGAPSAEVVADIQEKHADAARRTAGRAG